MSLELDKAEWLKDNIMDGSRHFYLWQGRVLVRIEVGKVIKNVCCVVMSVRVSVMCCGSVQHIIVTVELTSC